MLILFGVITGVAFVVYDSLRTRRGALPEIAPIESPTPAVIAPTAITPTTSSSKPVASSVEGASLFVPTAGIYAPIIEVYLDGTSWDISQLGANAGHLQGTAWLDDQPGNIVLSGHVEMADGRAGIFASLGDLKKGDPVILRQNGGETRYFVKEVRTVKPDDLTPLYPTQTDQLTLITCGQYNFFQNSYLERIVAIAERAT
jgi:LPXTG-site transpeptidase (sortase) family protein